MGSVWQGFGGANSARWIRDNMQVKYINTPAHSEDGKFIGTNKEQLLEMNMHINLNSRATYLEPFWEWSMNLTLTDPYLYVRDPSDDKTHRYRMNGVWKVSDIYIDDHNNNTCTVSACISSSRWFFILAVEPNVIYGPYDVPFIETTLENKPTATPTVMPDSSKKIDPTSSEYDPWYIPTDLGGVT